MSDRQRVVVDTSVYISALLTPHGTSRRAIDRAFERYVVAISADALAELEAKLSGDKFRRVLAPPIVEHFLEALVKSAEFFVPTFSRSRSRDPNDDKFLDLAEAIGAAYLITGDKDLLALEPTHGVAGLAILPPAEFLVRASGR